MKKKSELLWRAMQSNMAFRLGHQKVYFLRVSILLERHILMNEFYAHDAVKIPNFE